MANAGKKRAKSPIKYITNDIPAFTVPEYKCESYQSKIPDTLELQDVAELCINCLTEVTDPDYDYEVYWFIFFTYKPAFMRHEYADIVQIKFMEALPLLRTISGSRQNPHVETRWMETLMQQIGPDGLAYIPLEGRPWSRDNLIDGILVSDESDQTLNPFYNGRALAAMTLFAQRDPDGPWRDAVRQMVDGLNEVAVHDGDLAWFWPQCFYAVKNPPSDAKMPTTWANDCEVRAVPLGLVQAYRHCRYQPALDLAGKVNRYIRRNFFLADGTFIHTQDKPKERAHFHAHTASLLAMLEYGLEAGDQDFLDFVVKSYEFAKTEGEILVGYFPEFIHTESIQTSEICEVADMIALALKLSQAGIHDCWDDADRWLRNMFAECQLVHIDWIRRMPDSLAEESDHDPNYKINPVKETTDRVAERNRGGFASWPTMNEWYTGHHGPGMMHCCTGNAARTIYQAWHNILSKKNGQLKVNLLLNRASPWADVNSYIPHIGRVDVKIKQAIDLEIRIPEWAEPGKVECTVNGAPLHTNWNGRYAGFGSVRPDDTATMTFPIFEREDVVTVMKKKYTLVRKGNTVVDIDPPGRYAPLFQRRHYRQNQTRWRTIERFLSPEILPW